MEIALMPIDRVKGVQVPDEMNTGMFLAERSFKEAKVGNLRCGVVEANGLEYCYVTSSVEAHLSIDNWLKEAQEKGKTLERYLLEDRDAKFELHVNNPEEIDLEYVMQEIRERKTGDGIEDFSSFNDFQYDCGSYHVTM